MDEKKWAVICHFGGLVGGWIIPGIGGVLASLFIWGIGGSKEKVFFSKHAKEAVNFQISIFIYALITLAVIFGGLVAFPIVPVIGGDQISDNFIVASFMGFGIFALMGFFVLALIIVLEMLFVFVAVVKAANEDEYRYPMTIRLIK